MNWDELGFVKVASALYALVWAPTELSGPQHTVTVTELRI
jgi:hypothetical protein